MGAQGHSSMGPPHSGQPPPLNPALPPDVVTVLNKAATSLAEAEKALQQLS